MQPDIFIIFAKLCSMTFAPLGRYILRPVARRVCPFKNLWKYKSNLENLKTELKNLEDKKERVDGLTRGEIEPLPDVKDWLKEATYITNEVRKLITEDNPECCEGCTCSNLKECTGCCKGCTYSDLKTSYQHSNDVARMLKDVAQHLQKATRSLSSWQYKSNLENLKQQVEKLKLKRNTVQRQIKVGAEPLPQVKDWQENVDSIISKASELIGKYSPEHQDISEQQNEVGGMLKHVDKLFQEEFIGFFHPSIPEQTCLQPSIQQEFSESGMSILTDIIAALTKADVNMVGIYGMGGVGKTTLAKKVGSQAKQDNHFHEVVFVEVSQSPDIRTIQAGIAGHLGLELEGQTESIRASKLTDYLKKEEKKEKKILIILDNLWKEIKLEEDVGIPFGNNCKGLKLLLTARSQDVLTKLMKSQPNFHIKALSEEDAWALFKSTAGTCVDRPHLNSVALQVAKKCGGMPLAIVTVATALKDTEAKEEWNDALQRLDHPSLESFEGITKEVYSSIRLSYDYLHEERIKKIFLLCSRMGCTHDASIQDLFRYGLGLGYFDDFDTVEDALCNVYRSVNQLKAASLLLHASETDSFSSYSIATPAWESFAIHDVVCNVARSIVSKDQHVFTVINGHVPRSLTNDNMLKNCTSITLYNIDELSKDLELVCPNIKFLYVKPGYLNLTIPDNFFIGMSSLQVLHLIQIDLRPLPSSLSCLVNLQALCLDHCTLQDVVAIGGMKKLGDMNKLEVLSFRGSDITMLPEEMCQLTKLRLLDLTDCSDLSVIPSKVMSSLTGIEALYMNNTSIKWDDARPSIDELKHLRCLTTLEIHIPESKMFRGLISSEPNRYNISIGDVTYHWQARKPYSNKSRRLLRLKLDTKEDWIISQLPGVEELELEGDVVGAMNLLDDLGRDGFPQLMYLDVSANNHCVCIVNSVSCAVLPSLESLMVRYVRSLEKICNSPLGADTFLYLKTIRVENCNKLSNIFCFFSIVRVLPNLIDLEVFDCENVEEIFAVEEQDDGNSTEVVYDVKFSQVRYLRLRNLPKLKSFCRKAKTASPLQLASDTSASQIFSAKELNNHSSLFNEKVATPNLQDLEVSGIHHVKQIWLGLLPTLSFCVQNLTDLRVYGCDNLKELFSSCMTISEESREKERKDTIVFPKLNFLEIRHLTELTRLYSGYNVEFPSLKIFRMQSCPQFTKFIFDETVATPNLQDLEVSGIYPVTQIWLGLLPTLSFCVQNLTNLSVYECDNLRELFSSSMTISKESREKERKDTIVFPKLNFLEIRHLTELTRLYSGYNVEFPSLKIFRMQSCPQFTKFIFDETVATPNLQDLEVSGIYPVTQIWLGLLPTLSFCVQNLTNLSVYECDNLRELFSSSMTISKESREKERKDTIVFPKLNLLQIRHVIELERLCSGYNVEFPSLKIFKLQICHQFKEFIFDETVATPNLQDLEVSGIYNIKQIWLGLLPTLSFCVQNLIDLSVYECYNLKELFSSSMTTSKESREKERKETIVFPKLTLLHIRQLTKLKRLCFGYNVEFPSLKTFTIQSCPQFKESIFDETAVTPNLQNLKVSGIHRIEHIWLGLLPTLSSCMQNLTDLSVYECDNLKELFSSSMTILEESREKERKDTIVFPKLNFLEIGHLTKLTRLCSRYNVKFPSLKIFSIQSCPQFKEVIFDETIKVPSLEEMRISDMDNLKMIWHNKLTEDSFSKLKSLKVRMSKKLLTVFPSSMCGRLLSLESLNVEDCSSLVQICDLQGSNSEECDQVSFMNLRKLKVLRCPSLRYIFAKEGVVVKEMHAKFAFPKLTSLTLDLPQPPPVITVVLMVWMHCEVCARKLRRCIKDMIGVESVEFDFYKNQVVVRGVVDPSKLVDYISKITGKQASILKYEEKKEEEKKEEETKDRKVEGGEKKEGEESPIPKELVPYECGIHHTDEEGQMRQPLYLVQQLVFPCLEKFKLTGKELRMMGQAQVPECLFPKLKILKVQEHESTVFPLGIIQRFQNLEKLLLTGKGDVWPRPCSHKERFFCEEDQTQAAPLAKMKTLFLQYLGDLKYMWEQYSKWDLIFQNLEVLAVDTCNSLVNLMPPSASFQNLTILNVGYCDSLETIVTSSTAKSLMKLETMCISHCPKITEVIQNQGEVTEKIIFSNLKTLELIAADNLTSFCSCNFTLEFPSLEKLEVCGCRNMKTFSQGDLTMPRLEDVRIQREYFELYPDTNLNTIIQQFHAEWYSTKIDQGCSSSQHME